MKFKFDDVAKMVSHWMLEDIDIATKIANTEAFKERQETVAKITVNGVELPFEVFERYLYSLAEDTFNEEKAKFANQEAEVQRRLEERLKEEAQPVIDKLLTLQQTLEDAGSIIKPYWEK